MTSKKFIAGMIALAMAVAIVPGATQAATAEELAAQIAALQSQLAGLMGQLGTDTTATAGTVSATAPAACAGISFTRNLTLGSQGTDVKCLQTMLNQDPTTAVAVTGVGSAGNETMYFGGLTKAAVVAFQNKYAAEILAPVGLTAGTGFVGASTRAKLNAMLAGGTTGTTGDTGTTGTTGDTTTTGGLTMTGEEGSIVASINAVPANNGTSYEGDTKVSVYALKLKATGSDVDVQRVTLKFSAAPYSYLSNVYLYEGDTELKNSALNTSTVSKVGTSDYQITLSGFSSKMIIAKDTTKVLTVKVDVQPGISSSLLSSSGQQILIGTPSTTAIRGVDQAGLNQYTGLEYSSTYYRGFTIKPSQSTDATLTVSRNSASPLARNIVADSNTDIKGATLLTFNIKTTKDSMTLDKIENVAFTWDPSVAYLVDDSGAVIATGSAFSSHTTDFTDLNYVIAKDTTKTFSIKVDVEDLAAATTTAVTVDADNISAEKSNGATMTAANLLGTAVSNTAYLLVSGPQFALSNVSTTSTPSSTSASSTMTATYSIAVEAKGADVYIAADEATTTDAFIVKYNNTSALAKAKVAYQKPSGADEYTDCGVASNLTCYKIAQDTTANFTVTATYVLDTTAGNFYLNVSSVDWDTVKAQIGTASTETSTYMATDWKSGTVFLQ